MPTGSPGWCGRIDAAYTIVAVVCVEVWCRIFLDNYSGR